VTCREKHRSRKDVIAAGSFCETPSRHRLCAIDIGLAVLSVAPIPFVGVQPLVRRLKRAARWKRALRSCGIYVVSFLLLAILSSPIWIALLVWWR